MTDRDTPIPDPADEAKAWDLEQLEPEAWEGYRKFVDEYLGGVDEHRADADDERRDQPPLGYEIREFLIDNQGRTQIEAWLPGWLWPAVRIAQRSDGWQVVVGSEIFAVAGVSEVGLTGLDAINAEEARTWVKLLAALYVKATEK